MQGSFDSPPIIFRSSRILAAISLVVLGGLFASKLPSVLGILGVGSAVLLFGVLIVLPNELRLEPDGLTLKQMFRSTHWNWNDLSNFRLRHFGAISCDVIERIKYEDEPNYIDERPPIVSGVLGLGWNDHVVDVLEAARARWTDTETSHP